MHFNIYLSARQLVTFKKDLVWQRQAQAIDFTSRRGSTTLLVIRTGMLVNEMFFLGSSTEETTYMQYLARQVYIKHYALLFVVPNQEVDVFALDDLVIR